MLDHELREPLAVDEDDLVRDALRVIERVFVEVAGGDEDAFGGVAGIFSISGAASHWLIKLRGSISHRVGTSSVSRRLYSSRSWKTAFMFKRLARELPSRVTAYPATT